MSRNLGKYLFASSDLIVEVGFVIQGETSEELPERVLGGFRCYHLNVAKAMSVWCVCCGIEYLSLLDCIVLYSGVFWSEYHTW